MTGTIAALVLWAMVAKVFVLVPGTALPVSLNTTLDAKKARPGQPISAMVAQDVPLDDGMRIREGSHVYGHVVEVRRNADGSSYIRIQFDLLRMKKGGEFPIVTSLRAVASPWEVQEAGLPRVGPMIQPNPAAWTTFQVGGDAVYHGGGHVVRNHLVVGEPLGGDEVVSQLVSVPLPGCRYGSGKRRMAMWVFGAGACGPYGFFDHLEIGHPGDTDPVGDIVLESDKNVHVPTGTAMLLITMEPR